MDCRVVLFRGDDGALRLSVGRFEGFDITRHYQVWTDCRCAIALMKRRSSVFDLLVR